MRYLNNFQVKTNLIPFKGLFNLIVILICSLTYVNAQAPYCDPSGMSCDAGDGIDGVTIEDQDGNIVFSNTGTACGNNGYQDFTNISGTLTPGETYDVTVEILGTWEQGVALWLDYNNSDEFNEDHYLATSPSDNHTSANPAEFSFTLPENTVPGETRLRVGCLYFGIPDPSDYCGHGGLGEYEDYTINIPSSGPPTAQFFLPDTGFVGSNILIESQQDIAIEYSWYIDGVHVSDSNALVFNQTEPGNYTVTHQVTNTEGTAQYTRNIQVIEPTGDPEVNFYADKNVVTPREQVNLFDLTTQGPVSWDWSISPRFVPDPIIPGSFLNVYQYEPDIGDSLVQNPTVLFNGRLPGYYDVELTSKNSIDSTGSAKKEDYVLVAHSICPESDFEHLSTTNHEEGVLVDAGGGLSEGSWDAPYGDDNCNGFVIENICADDLYITTSDFEVACGDHFLRVYDGDSPDGEPLYEQCEEKGLNGFTGGGEQDECNSDDVCLPPDTLWSQSGSFYIEFEDGPNPDNLSGFRLFWGSSEEEDKSAPKAKFNAPDTVCVGQEVNFENQTVGGGIEGFAWDYQVPSGIDDSFTVDGAFTYTVPQNDPYKVHLYAWDCAGNVDTFEHEIIVVDPDDTPNANVKVSDNSPMKEDTVQLDSEIFGCYTVAEWEINPGSFEFVDGYDEYSKSPKVILNDVGCHSVSLNLENNAGTNTVYSSCLINVRGECLPQVGQSIQGIGTSRISINDIEIEKNVGEETYYDYTEPENFNEDTPIVVLEKGETYSITLTRPYTQYSMDRAIWIDYLKDGRIDSIDQVAYESDANTNTFTASFTVPKYAEAGKTRMRIGTGFGNSNLQYCGGENVGEYIDLAVKIQQDTSKPQVTLLGDNPYHLDVFSSFSDPGAEAYDKAYGNLTNQIDVDYSELDTSTIGEYNIHYKVTDGSGNSAKKSRTVYVEDNMDPIINLNGDDTVSVLVGHEFDDPGVNVSDNYWENIEPDVKSDLNVNELGWYFKEYCATDSSGNGPVCVQRHIEVIDTVAPSIEFEYDYVKVEAGSYFELPEYSLSDNYWPNDQIDLEIGGTFVGTDTLGEFNYLMTAIDGSGNSSVAELKIEVVDTTPPEISLNGEQHVSLYKGQEWNDPGVTVNDNYDTDPEIVIDGNFPGTEFAGSYSITYYAEDQSGNQSETLTRFINVGTTNIESEGEIGEFEVFPNPASDILIIRNSIEKSFEYEIIDLTGRKILDGKVSDKINSEYNIKLDGVSEGAYIIRFNVDGEYIAQEKIQVH